MEKIITIGEFTKGWNEESNARGFENCGVQVIRVPEENFNFDKFLEMVDREKPDLVLMAKLKIGERRDELIEVLKKRGIKTASWTFDLYVGLPRETLIKIDPIFKCDYVFGPDGGNVDNLRRRGVNYYLLRQGINDDYLFKGEFNEKYDYDVVFVGHWGYSYSPRGKMCDFLSKNYKFRWFGQRDTNHVRGKELNALYASAKIVVGDSFFAPYYWSNRIYETLGRGGFLMFSKIPGIEKEYEPYKHFIPYTIFNNMILYA